MPAAARSPTRVTRPAVLNQLKREVSTGNSLGPRGRSRESRRSSLNLLNALVAGRSSRHVGIGGQMKSLSRLWPEVSESMDDSSINLSSNRRLLGEPEPSKRISMDDSGVDLCTMMHNSMPLNLRERGLMDNHDDIFRSSSKRRTSLNLRVGRVHDDSKRTTTTTADDLMTAILAPHKSKRGRQVTRSRIKEEQEQEKTAPISFRVRSLSPSNRNRSPSPVRGKRGSLTKTDLTNFRYGAANGLQSSFHRLKNSLNTKEDRKAYHRGKRSCRSLSPKSRPFSVLAAAASSCAASPSKRGRSASPPPSSTSGKSRNASPGTRRGASSGSLAVIPPTYWEKPSVTLLRQPTVEMIEQAKKERMARKSVRDSQMSSQAGRAPIGRRSSAGEGWTRLTSSSRNLFEGMKTENLSKNDDQSADEGGRATSGDEKAGEKDSSDDRKARRRRNLQKSKSAMDLQGSSSSFLTGSRIRRRSGQNLMLLNNDSADDATRRRRGNMQRSKTSINMSGSSFVTGSRIRRTNSSRSLRTSSDDSTHQQSFSGLPHRRLVSQEKFSLIRSTSSRDIPLSALTQSVNIPVKSLSVADWTKHSSSAATPGYSENKTNGGRRSRSPTRSPTRVRTLSPCPSAA